MSILPGALGTVVDLLTVVIGFSLIVFVHELGHFLAARWAGIRVQTFALGFGPAMVSWRRGLGWRRGSSEPEYRELAGEGAERAGPERLPSSVSPTEYRVNALPLGGYVKMLGQEDLDPRATSAASDSYQNAPVWKRMVVISAGVAMNLATAAVMFVLVFLIGRDVSPPTIGDVIPGAPASAARAVDAPAGVEPGLRPGDEVLSVNGSQPRDFNELALLVATAPRDEAVSLAVRRDGVDRPLRYRVEAERDEASGLMSIGVTPPVTGELIDPGNGALRVQLRERLASFGLGSVPPGSRLVSVGAGDGVGVAALRRAAKASGGDPVAVAFETPDGRREATIRPRRRWMIDQERTREGVREFEHLLGLRPLLMVSDAPGGEDPRQGLERGDVFVRLGSLAYPGYLEGIGLIHDSAGREMTVAVERGGPGSPERVELEVSVEREQGEGRIGFAAMASFGASNRVSAVPGEIRSSAAAAGWRGPAALGLIGRAGTRVVSIDGGRTPTLNAVWDALVGRASETAGADEGGGDRTLTVEVGLVEPIGSGGEGAARTERWTLDGGAVERLADLGWGLPVGLAGLFEPERVTLQASGPLQAVAFGFKDTRNALVRTYLTIARLFDGTVRVEHLRGPVGIAHMGTLIADRGPVWLVWFFALLSVNLAVINFLPLPIVDGGQFLMLCYEGVRRKPVPLAVQSAVTAAGLLMIASLFLVLTFNDLRNLFGV